MDRLAGRRTHVLRIRAALIALLAALLALLGPAASAAPTASPELTVMTRNVYLGSSLQPALEAATPEEFIDAFATIYGTVVSTDFTDRARGLAAEIAASRPDIIGLQEVADWQVTPVADAFAVAPSFDFLELLLEALATQGLAYSVAGSVDTTFIGPVPLVSPGTDCDALVVVVDGTVPDCVVTFANRDVILVNSATTGLALETARTGRYASQVVASTAVGAIALDRGWVSVDARYRGRSFRFVTTRLESALAPSVQEAQAAEFLSGPALGRQVIAVGDFDSAPDGSTTSTYARLTTPLVDAWSVNDTPGLTCCQAPGLTNLTPRATMRTDLVLTRGQIRPVGADVVGSQPFQFTEPFWASDHAGVVATVRLRS